MTLNTTSLIRRHMKRSPAFVSCEDAAKMPVSFAHEQGDTLVGYYRNPPPWEHTFIVFTTSAMHVIDAESRTVIPYTQILEYETPQDKARATGVRVRTSEGFRFVRMAGRHGPGGRFMDAFNFVMILQVLVSRRGRSMQN